MNYQNSLCIFALSALSIAAHAAPTITGLSASQKSIPTGQPVTLTVKGEGLEESICALRVDYGDGTSTLRHMDWGKKVKFPLALTKSYAKPGQYTVVVAGLKSGKVLRCLGAARLGLQVTAPPPRP